MKKVLLHICCGICASYPVEKLRNDGFQVIGFFYNPNIHPGSEYLKRLEVAKKVALVFDYQLIEGAFDQDDWLIQVKGLETESEGGKRCEVCFKKRLEVTAIESRKLRCTYFTTTLSVSPHKDSKKINEIGKSLDDRGFLAYDFKKENGFKKSMDFAKEQKLYRQNYCGCIFSQK